METPSGNSLRSYSKIDEQAAEAAYRRKTRKRLTIILISTVVLVTIIAGAVVGTLTNQSKNANNNASSSPSSSLSDVSVKAMCNVTLYPDACYSSMSSALKASSNNDSDFSNPSPGQLFLLSLEIALTELSKLSGLPGTVLASDRYKNETSDPLVRSTLKSCEILFLDAVDQVNESVSAVKVGQGDISMLLSSKINDLRTWLSAGITDLDTCLEGLQESGKHLVITDEVRYASVNSTEYTSNSLAIASNVLAVSDDLHVPIHRKLLMNQGHEQHHHRDLDRVGFPRWVHFRDRRMLVGNEHPKPDLTVAKDGSGDYKSISEAVNTVPKRHKTRFIIYVKEGVYTENVVVDKDYWNVMMYGDGMNKTIVSGSLNKIDGVDTFLSGTFIAAGRGFIAKDMGFQNTAGPEKQQAVALRSSSDKSVFHRCSFNAYQDTLYTHSSRQFYRDCQVTGTIDFIFGNAAVVFQNCSIQPRQPMEKQFNTITAQGKTDPNQNTGISIQQCQMTTFDNLTATTYLGRPWRDYASTVVMQSFIGEFLDPLGWTSWEPNVEPPGTIFYAEYQNVGPGSDAKRRAAWPGVRPNITSQQAEKFTVEPLIDGGQWLPQADVMFDDTLL